jgi:hypothetical protein
MFEPKLVYKSPGDQHGPEGKTYSWAGVKTQEELTASSQTVGT